jgi:hypothetical protein
MGQDTKKGQPHKWLHKFEVACIANLCPQTPEEARCLIKSLDNPDKPSINELALILNEIQAKQCTLAMDIEL